VFQIGVQIENVLKATKLQLIDTSHGNSIIEGLLKLSVCLFCLM